MKLKSVSVLLILSLFFFSSSPAFAVPEPGFHKSLHKAFLAGLEGRKGRSFKAFEKLVQANPQEWIAYDFYTQILEAYDELDKAEAVYVKALPHFPERKDEIETRRKRLQDKKAFQALMKDAPLWKDAQVFGSSRLAVKTNLPESHYQPILKRIYSLIDREKALYEKILGKPEGDEGSLTVLIFGRAEEYFDYKGRSFDGVSAMAYYMPSKKEMVISYNGDADWAKIAHELSHHLIRQLYYANPSPMLDEGFAEYMAYKLEKEDGKRYLTDQLEFVNWFYDQGMLEKQEDFFKNWQVYERSHGVDRLSATNVFYILSWSLVAFMAEDPDPKVKEFFQTYYQFERRNAVNDRESVRWFFLEHLDPETRTFFQDKWLRFLLSRTYDNI